MFTGQTTTSAATHPLTQAAVQTAHRAAVLVHEAQSRSLLGSIGHGILVIILVIFFIGLVIGLVIGFILGRLFSRR